MAKKRKGPGGGNPAKRATLTNPCPKCKVRERYVNPQGDTSLWCLTCSNTARQRGNNRARLVRPSRAVVAGVAAALRLDS